MKKSARQNQGADQSARFIEAAREAGCEENFEQFEEALKRVVRYRTQRDQAVSARSSTRKRAGKPE